MGKLTPNKKTEGMASHTRRHALQKPSQKRAINESFHFLMSSVLGLTIILEESESNLMIVEKLANLLRVSHEEI